MVISKSCIFFNRTDFIFQCSSTNLLEASTPEEPEPEDELTFDDIEAEFLNIQMTQDALQA